MTNRDAINLLEEVKMLDDTMYAYNPCYEEALDMALTALKAEETWYATHEYPPELRWIPVTERLPEDEYVLISKKPTKLSGSKWCVTVAIRMADPRSGKIQWRDSGFGIIQDDEVLAWMPLPEPWKEGEAE